LVGIYPQNDNESDMMLCNLNLHGISPSARPNCPGPSSPPPPPQPPSRSYHATASSESDRRVQLGGVVGLVVVVTVGWAVR